MLHDGQMDTAPRYLEFIICCICCLSTVRFLTLDRQQRVGVLDPLERPRHPQLSSAYLDMATLLQIQTHFYMEDLSWHYTCGGTVHFCQVRISEIPEHIDHHRHRATGLPRLSVPDSRLLSCLLTVHQATRSARAQRG